MSRGYKYQSSAEIEALLEKKKKALERETISKITNEVVHRIKEICSKKTVDFSDGETNYIVEPCKNFERNVFKKKQAQKKNDAKEAA